MYIQILDLNTFRNQLNHNNTENHIFKYFLDISKFLPVCSSRTMNQKLTSYCPDHIPPHTRLFSSSITFSGIDIIFSLDTEYLLKKTKSKKTLVSSSLSNQSQILILRSLKSGVFFPFASLVLLSFRLSFSFTWIVEISIYSANVY